MGQEMDKYYKTFSVEAMNKYCGERERERLMISDQIDK